MKYRKLTLACSTLVLAATSAVSVAEDTSPHSFSANVALATDYVWRGFSQTDNNPAIQGGFDYAHSSGFYLGTWASNVESDPTADYNYDGSSMELDLYAGWGGDFNGVGVDLGALHYEYPGTNTNDNNTNEYHLGVNYDFGVASAGVTANYSDDYFGAGNTYYWDLGAEVPVGQFTLAAHYGITDYDDDDKGDDYEDWRIGASTEFGGFGFDLSYTDTSGVAGGCSQTTCDGTTVFTISKEL